MIYEELYRVFFYTFTNIQGQPLLYVKEPCIIRFSS